MPANQPGRLAVSLHVEGKPPFEGVMPEATAIDLYDNVVSYKWHEPEEYPKALYAPDGTAVTVNSKEEEDATKASWSALSRPATSETA